MPPDTNLTAIEIGTQKWLNGRLIKLCSAGTVGNTGDGDDDNACVSDFILGGKIPHDIYKLTNLKSSTL